MTRISILTFFFLAFLALSMALRYLKRARSMEDIPTSYLRSAAAGLVEIVGNAKSIPGNPILSPYGKKPCVYYKYRIETYTNDRQNGTVEYGGSDQLFALDDGTGMCVVNPTGAIVSGYKTARYFHQSYPYKKIIYESVIPENTSLYVIGELGYFQQNSETQNNTEVSFLLKKWKKNYDALVKQHDSNHKGILDREEWERVVKDAEQFAREKNLMTQHTPSIYVIEQPSKQKDLFLISSFSQKKIIRQTKFGAFVSCIAFVAFLILAFKMML